MGILENDRWFFIEVVLYIGIATTVHPERDVISTDSKLEGGRSSARARGVMARQTTSGERTASCCIPREGIEKSGRCEPSRSVAVWLDRKLVRKVCLTATMVVADLGQNGLVGDMIEGLM